MECIFNKYHLETSRSHHFQQMPVYHWQIEMFCISPSLQSDFKWQQRVVSPYLDTPDFWGIKLFFPGAGICTVQQYHGVYILWTPFVIDWTSWILQLIVCNNIPGNSSSCSNIIVLGVFWYTWTFRLTDFWNKNISKSLIAKSPSFDSYIHFVQVHNAISMNTNNILICRTSLIGYWYM